MNKIEEDYQRWKTPKTIVETDENAAGPLLDADLKSEFGVEIARMCYGLDRAYAFILGRNLKAVKEDSMKNLQEKLDKLKQEHRQTQANLLKLEGAIAIVAKLIEEETGGTDVG